MFRRIAFATRAALAAGLVAAPALLAPAAAHAQQPEARPTVAILYFNNGSFGPGAKDYDNLGRGIADFLITEMAGNPGIRVVERDRIAQITAEQDLGASNRIDPETAVRLGKLLGAQYLVTGGFIATPKGEVRLDARAIQTESGRILHTESVTDKADNFVDLISALAGRLNTGMRLPALPGGGAAAPSGGAGDGDRGAAPASSAPAAKPKKPPFQAVMLYARAIAAKDRGNTNEAVTLFRQSLEKFPEFDKAKDELAKLGGGA
jgi:TolB-like protein